MKLPVLSSKKTLAGWSLIMVLLAAYLFQGFSLSHQIIWTAYDSLHTAERSRQMLLSPNPLTVKRNFAKDHNKPPLQYWLTAPLLKTMPDPVLALTFWPMIFGLSCLVLTGLWALLLQPGDKAFALWAPAFMATSILLMNGSSVALLDTGMTAFLLLTAVSYEWTRKYSWGWWLVGAGVVLGFLQKVPLGLLYLPVVMLADRFTGVEAPSRQGVHFRRACWFWGVFGMIWPASQVIIYGVSFWNRFFKAEMFDRMANSQGSDAVSVREIAYPIWANWPYITVLALGGLFFFCFVRKKKDVQSLLPPALFLLGYMAIGLFCSFEKERYFLPIVPFIALWAAWGMGKLPLPVWAKAGVICSLVFLLSFSDLLHRRETLIQKESPSERKIEEDTFILQKAGEGIRNLRQNKEPVVVFNSSDVSRYFYSGIAYFAGQRDAILFWAPRKVGEKAKKIKFSEGSSVLLLAKPEELEKYPALVRLGPSLGTSGDYSFYRAQVLATSEFWQRTY